MSVPCNSSDRRSELKALFWQARVMASFRAGTGTSFNVPEIVNVVSLSKYLFQPTYPCVVFSVETAWFGDECYLAFVAEGMVVVPPFPIPLNQNRQDIPLFPEELTCSASR
jgi:hypothetical protein